MAALMRFWFSFSVMPVATALVLLATCRRHRHGLTHHTNGQQRQVKCIPVLQAMTGAHAVLAGRRLLTQAPAVHQTSYTLCSGHGMLHSQPSPAPKPCTTTQRMPCATPTWRATKDLPIMPWADKEPPWLVKLPPVLPAQLVLVHMVLPISSAPPAVAAARKLPSLRGTMEPAARLLLPVVL